MRKVNPKDCLLSEGSYRALRALRPAGKKKLGLRRVTTSNSLSARPRPIRSLNLFPSPSLSLGAQFAALLSTSERSTPPELFLSVTE